MIKKFRSCVILWCFLVFISFPFSLLNPGEAPSGVDAVIIVPIFLPVEVRTSSREAEVVPVEIVSVSINDVGVVPSLGGFTGRFGDGLIGNSVVTRSLVFRFYSNDQGGFWRLMGRDINGDICFWDARVRSVTKLAVKFRFRGHEDLGVIETFWGQSGIKGVIKGDHQRGQATLIDSLKQ